CTRYHHTLKQRYSFFLRYKWQLNARIKWQYPGVNRAPYQVEVSAVRPSAPDHIVVAHSKHKLFRHTLQRGCPRRPRHNGRLYQGNARPGYNSANRHKYALLPYSNLRHTKAYFWVNTLTRY